MWRMRGVPRLAVRPGHVGGRRALLDRCSRAGRTRRRRVGGRRLVIPGRGSARGRLFRWRTIPLRRYRLPPGSFVVKIFLFLDHRGDPQWCAAPAPSTSTADVAMSCPPGDSSLILSTRRSWKEVPRWAVPRIHPRGPDTRYHFGAAFDLGNQVGGSRTISS